MSAETIASLLDEVRDLPNPERSLLTHNERVLIELCKRLGAALETIELAPSSFQSEVEHWIHRIAHDDPTDLSERTHRFTEEAMELTRALGQTREEAQQLVDYVHDQAHVGAPAQEAGGTMTTFAAMATYADLDMWACGAAELVRVNTREMVAKIRAKRSQRHGRGPLPGSHEPDFLPSQADDGGRS